MVARMLVADYEGTDALSRGAKPRSKTTVDGANAGMASLFRFLTGARPAAAGRDDPIVIGGTGGSGTRVVHGVLQAAGVYVGWRVNHAGDAMDMEPSLDAWVSAVVESTESTDYAASRLPAGIASGARADIAAAVATYASEIPERCALWGWKNPRSIFIWPLLAEIAPNLRIIHLVRDGRDMAFSDNQNQLRKHGVALIGGGADEITPARSIALWAKVNGDAADWGERVLGDRYRRFRFEDLCEDPIGGAAEILHFAGFDREEADRWAPEAAFRIERPASLGRWREQPSPLLDDLLSVAGTTLARFGYEV